MSPPLLNFNAIIWLSWILSGTCAQDPFFQFPPTNTFGVENTDVTLYCQVENKGDIDLYWHCTSHNDTLEVIVGPDVNTNMALPRYIIDDFGASLGQYNLIITNVTKLDSGTCNCLILDRKGNPKWSEAQLEIVDLPERPEEPTCNINKDRTPGQPMWTFLADDTVQLHCESNGGVPLADIYWEIVRDEDTNSRGTKIPSVISTTANSITATADYDITFLDDNAYFRCVQNHVTDTPFLCSPTYTDSTSGITRTTRPILVKYPPVLNFIPETVKVNLDEEITNQTIRCNYKANPELDYGPFIRHRPVFINETLNMIYSSKTDSATVDLILVPDDVGKFIECVAGNELGETIKTIETEGFTKDQDTDFPTWTIVVIIMSIGLLLFVITAVSLFFFFRKQNRRKFNNNSADRINKWQLNSDTSSSISSEESSEDVEDQKGLRGDGKLEERNLGYNEEGDEEPDDELENIDIDEFEGGKELQGTPEEEDDPSREPPPSLDPGLFQPAWSSRLYDQIPLDLY